MPEIIRTDIGINPLDEMDEDNKPKVEELPEDIFGREEIARSMCELIVNLPAEEYSPFVLDGPWGCGKTVHARRIMKCFCDDYADKVKIIYWNASESDYSDNPLLMFVSLLYNNISTLDSCGKRAVKICSQILLGAFGGLASVGTQFINRFSGLDIKGIIPEVEETSKQCDCCSQLEQQFESILKKAGSEKEQVDGARELLQLVQDEGKELIVIIDELDRCRPDFALKTLEIIKHLFTHPNVKFLMVLNKKSLACSVKHMYGLEDEAASCYLRKYIKIEFTLPACASKRGESHSVKIYYLNLLEKVDSAFSSDNKLLNQFLNFITHDERIQFREVEKHVSVLKLLLNSDRSLLNRIDKDFSSVLLCFTSYIISFENKIVTRLFSRTINKEDVMALLSRGKDEIIEADYYGASCFDYIEAIINCYLATFEDYVKFSHNYGNLFQPMLIQCGRNNLIQWLSYYSFLTV